MIWFITDRLNTFWFVFFAEVLQGEIDDMQTNRCFFYGAQLTRSHIPPIKTTNNTRCIWCRHDVFKMIRLNLISLLSEWSGYCLRQDYCWCSPLTNVFKCSKLPPESIGLAGRRNGHTPPNTKHLYNINAKLDRRRRRWAGVVQMLYKCFVFAGTCTPNKRKSFV